jgi:hypothetical protein
MRIKLAGFLLLLTLYLSGCAYSLGGDKILYKDDFSDPTSGWDQTLGFDGESNYYNGSYRIVVKDINKDIWANPGLDFSDASIAVDATKVAGPDQNDFGLICRYKNPDNYYFFIISSEQYYSIGKYRNGERFIISESPPKQNDKINPGNDKNHIRADCVGNQLTLYVNNVKLVQVTDSDFPSGDVGLIAGTFDLPGVEILFDNFVVSEPS